MKYKFEKFSLAAMTIATALAVSKAVSMWSLYVIENEILDPMLLATVLSFPWIYFGAVQIFRRIFGRIEK